MRCVAPDLLTALCIQTLRWAVWVRSVCAELIMLLNKSQPNTDLVRNSKRRERKYGGTVDLIVEEIAARFSDIIRWNFAMSHSSITIDYNENYKIQ